MTPCNCEHCRIADRHASYYSPEEYEFLTTKTGLIIGQRERLPIISAVFILRSGRRHFACMTAEGQVYWNTPTFRCPWARPALPAILTHGPDVFTTDGIAIDQGRPMLDEQGHFRRMSHCPIWRPHEYYVRPILVHGLPRRAV